MFSQTSRYAKQLSWREVKVKQSLELLSIFTFGT